MAQKWIAGQLVQGDASYHRDQGFARGHVEPAVPGATAFLLELQATMMFVLATPASPPMATGANALKEPPPIYSISSPSLHAWIG